MTKSELQELIDTSFSQAIKRHQQRDCLSDFRELYETAFAPQDEQNLWRYGMKPRHDFFLVYAEGVEQKVNFENEIEFLLAQPDRGIAEFVANCLEDYEALPDTVEVKCQNHPRVLIEALLRARAITKPPIGIYELLSVDLKVRFEMRKRKKGEK